MDLEIGSDVSKGLVREARKVELYLNNVNNPG